MDSNKRRQIRSFVRRAGRMTEGQKRAMEQLWPVFGIDNISGMLNFTTVFDRSAPTTLEIGFGNGDNLVDMALAAPDNNFLGIEVHEPGIGHCLLRIEDHGLSNIRLIQADAVDILGGHIADATLDRVNLFFPDPWHKKRHHKRRIVQSSFIQLLARKLQPGGLFHVATDWPDYAAHIADIMSAATEFELQTRPPADRPVSRFDTRGARLGHENWEQAWRTCSKFPIP